MTKTDQEKILSSICDSIRDKLLQHSENWPEEWNGFELRELAFKAFEYERVSMAGGRRRDFNNEWTTRNLY